MVRFYTYPLYIYSIIVYDSIPVKKESPKFTQCFHVSHSDLYHFTNNWQKPRMEKPTVYHLYTVPSSEVLSIFHFTVLWVLEHIQQSLSALVICYTETSQLSQRLG